MAMGAVEAYKKAWALYRENLGAYIVGAAVLMVLAFAVALPVAVIHVLLLLSASSAGNPSLVPLVLVADFALILCAVLVSGVFRGAYVGVCYDVVQGEKVDWRRLLHWAKVRWQTFAGIILAQVVVVLLVMLPFIAVGLVAGMALSMPLLVLPFVLLGIPFVVLASGAMQLAIPKAVAEFAGAKDSLSGAFSLVRANLAQFVLLMAIGFVLSILAIIPLVAQLVLMPLTDTAFVLFYLSDKKPKKKR